MKPEQQRIAIAEACGWKYWRDLPTPETGELLASYISPNATESVRFADDLPDYLNDLNACHEMEDSMTPEQAHYYNKHLEAAFSNRPWHDDDAAKNYGWHATAADRCEAFLKALNLWTE